MLTYEWNRSSSENLLLPEVQQKIMSMLSLGCFASVSLAPICASFSTAVTPPVRTTRHPRGRPGLSKAMRRKVGEGNLHCIGFMIENPDCSWLWRQKEMKKFRDPASRSVFRFAFCRFGTAWQKNTRMGSNTRLGGLRMMCSCTLPHHQLRGFSKTHKKAWAAVAEPFPLGLCRLVGRALA